MINLYATQGGGTAVWIEDQRAYIFVKPPRWSTFKPHDFVPDQWDLVYLGLFPKNEMFN